MGTDSGNAANCVFQHSKHLWPEGDVTFSLTEFTKIVASSCAHLWWITLLMEYSADELHC